MKISDALMVMNPRRIKPVMQALEELPISQIRVVGHTEKQIEQEAFPEVLDVCGENEWDWLWVVSDDAIVRPYALAAVRLLARSGRHRCVTGYSQRTHDNWTVNLTKSPLRSPHPGVEAYEFMSYAEVVSHPERVIRTWFAGMSLTGMAVADWKLYPFTCFGGSGHDTGYSSDYSLSYRLQAAGVPIAAAREGFCYHWRADWVSTNNDEDQSPRFDEKHIEIVT